MFLKNREFRIRAVNTKKNEDRPPTVNEVLNPDYSEINEKFVKSWIRTIALTAVGIVVVVKVVDALCEIGVEKSKNSDHE